MGYCTCDSCSGHRAVYELGLTDWCADLERQRQLRHGILGAVLGRLSHHWWPGRLHAGAGFREDAARFALGRGRRNREHPLGRHLAAMAELAELGEMAFPSPAWMSGVAGQWRSQFRTRVRTPPKLAIVGE